MIRPPQMFDVPPSAHPAGNGVLVSLTPLLDRVESIELRTGFPIVALQNNDAQSACAQLGRGDQTRNAAANNAHATFLGLIGIVVSAQVMDQKFSPPKYM